MIELEQIAASVAKALGLKPFDERTWFTDERGPKPWLDYLHIDGSNLFDPYWQVRCRDWLLERGYVVFDKMPTKYHVFGTASRDMPDIVLDCPASEFCARAIHALDKQER